MIFAEAEIVDEIHEVEVVDTSTLTAPTDDEIQRQIAEDHAREMARLEG